MSKLRIEKCVGVWGSGHHRCFGQIGGARNFQVGSSHRGCPHARGRRCVAMHNHAEVDTKRRCLGRQVSIAVHGGESSPLSGCGTMDQSTVDRTFRSLTLWISWLSLGKGFKPTSLGEAQTSSCKRRRRVVASGSDTEIDPESHDVRLSGIVSSCRFVGFFVQVEVGVH